MRIQKLASDPEYPNMLSSDAEYVDNLNRAGYEGMYNEGFLNSKSASENELNNRGLMTEYD